MPTAIELYLDDVHRIALTDIKDLEKPAVTTRKLTRIKRRHCDGDEQP